MRARRLQHNPTTFITRAQKSEVRSQKSEVRSQMTVWLPSVFRLPTSALLRRPGGHCEGQYTRSHPELGRENPQRRWYSVLRRGRAGHRQVFQEELRKQMSDARR